MLEEDVVLYEVGGGGERQGEGGAERGAGHQQEGGGGQAGQLRLQARTSVTHLSTVKYSRYVRSKQ